MLCDSVSLFLLSAISSNKEVCADDYQQLLERERERSPKVLIKRVSSLAGWLSLSCNLFSCSLSAQRVS